MKQTTDYNKVPECCKRCMFKEYDPFNYGNYSCLKNLHLPTKKQQCKKQKLTKKYRFIKFLKDENILKEFYDNWKGDDGCKLWHPDEYISGAFEWGCDKWPNLNDKWCDILIEEYG